jgi:CubicO group peptidase (beta-lactamase class C family)
MTSIDPVDLAAACRLAADYLDIRRRVLRVPGVQAAVVRGSDVLLDTAAGWADVEDQLALTPDHLFRIASHSKTFTATIVLQLVEEGRLRLDDPLGERLEWVPDAARAVTLRELLAHGSGLTRDGEDADHWVLGRQFPDATAFRASLGEAVAVIPANERFKYSNVGFSLLGLVIEQVTGQSFAANLQERVADRLGLRDTAADVIAGRGADYATAYTALSYADNRLPIDQIGTFAMAAATGVTSTAVETARYFAAHAPGDERLLTDASRRLAQRQEWEIEGTGGQHYGLGFGVDTVDDHRLVGHGGGFPGHITRSLLDLETGLAVSVFTNAIDGPASELALGVMKLLRLAVDAEAAPGPGAAELERFSGSFATIWGRLDVARFGSALTALQLNQVDPTANRDILVREDEHTLRVSRSGSGFGSHGELMRYRFGGDDRPAAARLPGGLSAQPLPAFVAGLAGRSRISLPSRPGSAP